MEDIRNQAWKYFEMHAGQRMSIFNFYITISTAILAAIGVFLSIDKIAPLLIAAFGLLLILFSIVFWGLDMRTKNLIHIAEEIILDFEKNDKSRFAQIFTTDRKLYDNMRFRVKSYTNLFGIVYIIFILIGIALIMISATNNLP